MLVLGGDAGVEVSNEWRVGVVHGCAGEWVGETIQAHGCVTEKSGQCQSGHRASAELELGPEGGGAGRAGNGDVEPRRCELLDLVVGNVIIKQR